jgi:hypothetical protein
MMSVARFANPNRRPVFHLLELLQIALGETPGRHRRGLARQDALAVEFVLGTIRRQFPRLPSRERFWLPELPLEPDPAEAI